MEMNVKQLRQEIPVTECLIYMNTGWSGPSPRVVVESIKERLEMENLGGPASSEVLASRKEILKEARAALSKLLSATVEEICLLENTTEGINIVINGLPWHADDEVVTCNLEHSSVIVPCYFLQRRRQVRVKLVRLEANDDEAAIITKLESAMSPRTRLLCLSHIAYCNGLRLPLGEIQQMARRHGALLLVDGAQSVGHIPVNLRELACDFYALPGQKWLLGPDGVGALFIRRELISEVEPSKVANHAASFYDLEGNLVPNAHSIRKFELTTTSSPLLAGFAAAIRFIEAIGLDAIKARIMTLSARLKGMLLEIPGVKLCSPTEQRMASGLVAFAIEGVEHEVVTSYLWESERIVARSISSPPSTRFSVEFFNTEEELKRVAQAVRQLSVAGSKGR